MFEGILNPIFGPVMNLPDPYGLLIICFLMSALITLIYKYTTDQKKMRALKDELKEIQQKIKDMKDEPKKAMKLQKEMMSKNMEYMKHSMKPTLYTFIPIIFIFGWLRNYYTTLGNPDVFFGLSWFWSYFVFSLIFSMILRKMLKIY